MKSLPSIWCFTAFAPGTSAPSTAVVRKIRLPQTMGDECDRPSIGVFHLMFFVGLHSDGRFFSFEMPEPSGPRHCGQFPAETVRATKLRDPSAREIPTIRVRAIRFTVVFPFLFIIRDVPVDPRLILRICWSTWPLLQTRTDARSCARSGDHPRLRAWPS